MKKIVFFIILFVSCGMAFADSTNRYVVTTNLYPVSPFTNWVDAATNIQNAIDASFTGDIVWVSNGVYNTASLVYPGGAQTNRVVIKSAITVRSVNGPANTIIQGEVNIRGVYMVANSKLIGFTVTGGNFDTAANIYGAGMRGDVTSAVVSNCIVSGNTAKYGGGAYKITMYNCLVASNYAGSYGGGVRECELYNCTLAYNNADDGGGAYNANIYNCLLYGNYSANSGGAKLGTLYNCTIAGNSASSLGGGTFSSIRWNCISWLNNCADYGGTNYYSCGVGLTNGGSIFGCITNNPKFMLDGSGYGANHIVGDYRLQARSPCINTGTNGAWTVGAYDLDGRRRLDKFSGKVDMGAYEFLPPGTMFIIN